MCLSCVTALGIGGDYTIGTITNAGDNPLVIVYAPLVGIGYSGVLGSLYILQDGTMKIHANVDIAANMQMWANLSYIV